MSKAGVTELVSAFSIDTLECIENEQKTKIGRFNTAPLP